MDHTHTTNQLAIFAVMAVLAVLHKKGVWMTRTETEDLVKSFSTDIENNRSVEMAEKVYEDTLKILEKRDNILK